MYKKLRIIWEYILLVIILTLGSCSKSAFDINSPNPNLPSDVPPNFVLSAALTSSANLMLGGDANFANFWMGYWAPYGEQSPSVLSYNLTSDSYSANWDSTYVTLENYKFIIDHTGNPEGAYYNAMARIMEVFHYQRLVDQYNNVPYHEALQGTNSFPTYDKAEDIYKDLIVQLDTAIIVINHADLSLVDD